ncbi:MAG: T9SS type A sorting domain-containing protein [Bacteroidota bacterium]
MDMDTDLSIIDLNGREVVRTRVFNDPQQIDLSGLTRGVYLIRTITDHVSEAKRLVKY